eukprot:6439650-Pyramimonas_sp.AAC.1
MDPPSMEIRWCLRGGVCCSRGGRDLQARCMGCAAQRVHATCGGCRAWCTSTQCPSPRHHA